MNSENSREWNWLLLIWGNIFNHNTVNPPRVVNIILYSLTHWCLNKTILQTLFWNVFSWKQITCLAAIFSQFCVHWQQPSFGTGIGLTRNWWRAITCRNNDWVQWHIYASLNVSMLIYMKVLWPSTATRGRQQTQAYYLAVKYLYFCFWEPSTSVSNF